MATIIEYDGKQYLLTVAEPEKEWIGFIAQSLGMTKETVVGAALNQGLTHYVQMLTKLAEQTDDNGHAEVKENGDSEH